MKMYFNRLRRWVQTRREWLFPDGETYDLLEMLEKKQRDIRYLEFQLAKTRADQFELEQKPMELRDTIAGILKESDEQLRSTARFQVWRAETDSGWEVVTDHCCLGGCDLNSYTFSSERDALLFAQLLDMVGYHPPHNIACPACYEEHMKDCI